MTIILKPIEKLMDFLTYPKKFFLIFVLFFIPLVTALSFIVLGEKTPSSSALARGG